jgi:uncharacterized protein
MPSPLSTSPAIVITGASGGIGEALAYQFAREKSAMLLVARSKDGLERVARGALAKGAAQVEILPLDLARVDAIDQLEARLVALGLYVETLVNNAGYGIKGAFADMDEAAEIGMVELNIRALTALCRRFLPGMIARGKGGIVNLASTAAFAPGPLMAVYYASKSYVLSFSRALGNEVAGKGVTITAICPGVTATGFQERASLENARVTRLMPSMTAEQVAAIGYRGYRAGKNVVVTGTMNRLMAVSSRFAPTALLLAVTRHLHGGGH